MIPACYFGNSDHGIRCELCPRACVISEGNSGFCGAYAVHNGILYAVRFGKIVGMAVDPIEKKPLYHFYPGSSILSVAQHGCNLRCVWCQNHHLSAGMEPIDTPVVDTGSLVRYCVDNGHHMIAFTYSEPIIWYEYIREFSEQVKQTIPGFSVVLVSNGYISEQPLRNLIPFIDAVNLDIKTMSDASYRTFTGGTLQPVLRTAKIIAESSVHLEITNLIVTGINDNSEEISELARWIADECGNHIPLHISRYHTAYKCKAPDTPLITIENAWEIARKTLHYVYTGNVTQGHADTVCRACGSIIISRTGYSINTSGLAGSDCKQCGSKLYGRFVQ